MSGELQAAISWLWTNPLYGFAGLVGLCIGIFYGFDGWRGNAEELALQDSPRVKNLLWILGPGIAAFIGDVKALDPDAKKPLLLLTYFLPCVVGAVVVVVFWGIWIGIGRVRARSRGETYGLSEALGDYFFYGYRYFRQQCDAEKQKRMRIEGPVLKIGLFLDVDLTITQETIQRVYAKELGLKERFDKLEALYQEKKINAGKFGRDLIELFAEKKFSKKMAEHLFEKVELRAWVDKLFLLQERGVDIYLVSSGPNYYIEALARQKNIPIERTISSTYEFADQGKGIISKCDAIEDDQKTKFVSNERGKYDITIGIGDNDGHDAFVAVCTIALLVAPETHTPLPSKYMIAPSLNPVFQLISNLVEKRVAPSQQPPADARRRQLAPSKG
jgi:HAD superfamily phosphoserine phosphatase-like hydrolase